MPATISSYDVLTDNETVRKGFVCAYGQPATLSIGHDCTCLTLYLTSFNHVNAPKIRFAVKVEGLDGDWVYMAPGENVLSSESASSSTRLSPVDKRLQKRNSCLRTAISATKPLP